jgi:hypothetical protein
VARFFQFGAGGKEKKYGIGDRSDILTIPDLIDFDEGRFPEGTKTA